MEQNKIKPRGLIHEKTSLEKFKLDLIAPPEALSSIISRFWHVSWDLPDGETYKQANLPFPVQHLVIDPQGGSGLFGCTLDAFTYEISGKGSVLGARFFPGIAKVLTAKPMTEITGQNLKFREIFARSPDEFEALLTEDLDELISKISELILAHATPITDQMSNSRAMVEFIEAQDTLTDLPALSETFDLSARQIQRLFHDYIGVSPKWVIDRYRIFGALDALNQGTDINLAELALQLGYVDQAHFSKVFKKLTGESPKKYLKAQMG